MAITRFGNKMLRGTKGDRVSDSLGSDADGTNSGITLLTTTNYQTISNSGSATYIQLPTNGTIVGEKFASGNVMVGKSVRGLKVRLRKNSSPSGTITAGIVASSSTAGNFSTSFTTTLSASDLTTSYVEYEFTGNLGNVSADDIVGIKFTGSGGNVEIEVSDGNSMSNNTLQYLSSTPAWQTNSYHLKGSIAYYDTDNFKLGTGAYSFDGSDDKVAVSSASTYAFLNDKSSDWTIAWWHKNTKGTISSHGQMLFATSDNGGSADGFYCDLRSGNGLRAGFQGSNGSAGGNATWSGVVPTDATVWTHFALVCDVSESKLALYKNGTLVSNESVSWSAGYDSDFPLNIGCRVDTQFLQCDLDDIGIWKRVLTATEVGKLANNNDDGSTGWSKTSSNINIQNNRVDFDTTSSGNSTSALSYDIGTANISGTWVLRGKSVLTTYTVGGDGSSCHLFVGFSDKDHTTAFDGNQDSISFAIGAGTNDDNYYIGSSDGGAMYSMTNHTTGQTTHEPTEETLYWELKRTGTTGVTLTLYTDSGYSTSPSGYSKSVTLSSEPTGLRYLVFKSRDRSVSGSDCIGYIDDLKFWDNTTTASGDPDNTFEFTSGDAQLVSSLSDKSNLKAYYSMDTETTVTADGTSQTTANNQIQVQNTNSSEDRILGYQVTTGSPFVGKTITGFKVKLRNAFSASGTFAITGGIWSTSESNPMTTIGRATSPTSVTFDQLETGTTWSANSVTSGSDVVTYNLSSPYTIQSGDLIGVRPAGGTFNSSSVVVNANSSSVDGNANMKGYRTSWLDYSSWDMWLVVITSTDKCSNDFSATSDLDTMTNLPENTIFFQTDDTPHYRWLQSGVWELDAKSAIAFWSTADTSAMYVGGTTSAWTANNATQTWNGTSWASSTNLTNARELLDGGGNATDYISVAGDSGGAGSPQDDVYKWNGSSWSSGGTISSNSFMLSAGGNTSGALWCGGNNGSGAISTAQTYDGSSWTSISSMSDTRRGHLGDGTETDFLAVGGYDDGSSTQRTAIEAWNGTSWSAGTDYDGSNGDMYGYGGGAGRTSSFIAQTNQRSQSNTYTYNGGAWSLTGNSTGGSVNYSGLGGSNTNTIKAGGADGSSWAVNTSELFNGTSWTATNNLATGISTGGMGGNS